MELRWLDDFIALARTRHFSRAADERNCTQPTLSRRIKLLEDEMGVTLIDRNTLPLSLTPAGEVFLAGAEQMSRIARETKSRCGEIREKQLNRLVFATTQTLYLCFYNAWIEPFSSEHGIDIELNLKSTAWVGPDFVSALAQGECDLALCYWHPAVDFLRALNDDRFESLTVANEVLVPVTALDEQGQPLHQLPGKARKPLPYIGYHEGAFARPVIQQFIQQQLEPPQLVTMNENFHAVSVKAMVKEGFGLGWIPKRLIGDSLRYNQLALAGDERWHIPLQIRLYRLRHNHNSSLDVLWSLIADQVAEGVTTAL
ncbi:LysR family transcriptional regulator [Marinobacterium sp. D7]|uniref:LysR family transcriptional regulator n=1 Tax=Marinobacterium ramblicola TaxID=2849041 RepID=UPI001C2DD18A|nr:LysR family transcriptional regulator [Marinobacterium ramblicola]MBV1788536.1 LysR family transcriptional regulator [Marinobacterium ramblicola]